MTPEMKMLGCNKEEFQKWLTVKMMMLEINGHSMDVTKIRKEDGEFVAIVYIDGIKKFAGFDGFGYSIHR